MTLQHHHGAYGTSWQAGVSQPLLLYTVHKLPTEQNLLSITHACTTCHSHMPPTRHRPATCRTSSIHPEARSCTLYKNACDVRGASSGGSNQCGTTRLPARVTPLPDSQSSALQASLLSGRGGLGRGTCKAAAIATLAERSGISTGRRKAAPAGCTGIISCGRKASIATEGGCKGISSCGGDTTVAEGSCISLGSCSSNKHNRVWCQAPSCAGCQEAANN